MFKLAIAALIVFAAKFTLKSEGVDKVFSVTLTAKRLGQDDVSEQLEAVEFRFKDFLLSKDLVSNWENQRLVLLDDDTPAPFSPDAFAYMLDQQGVAKAIYDTYLRECGAKAKN